MKVLAARLPDPLSSPRSLCNKVGNPRRPRVLYFIRAPAPLAHTVGGKCCFLTLRCWLDECACFLREIFYSFFHNHYPTPPHPPRTL